MRVITTPSQPMDIANNSELTHEFPGVVTWTFIDAFVFLTVIFIWFVALCVFLEKWGNFRIPQPREILRKFKPMNVEHVKVINHSGKSIIYKTYGKRMSVTMADRRRRLDNLRNAELAERTPQEIEAAEAKERKKQQPKRMRGFSFFDRHRGQSSLSQGKGKENLSGITEDVDSVIVVPPKKKKNVKNTIKVTVTNASDLMPDDAVLLEDVLDNSTSEPGVVQHKEDVPKVNVVVLGDSAFADSVVL